MSFSADVDWAKQNGATIARFNLSQQPLAFAENALVKVFLERSGADALPLILVDGEVALAGRYPTRVELARWASIKEAEETPPSTLQADLRRAGIEPWAWIINNSVAATTVHSPLLRQRAANELHEIDLVAHTHAQRYAVVPLLEIEPVGVELLQKMATTTH